MTRGVENTGRYKRHLAAWLALIVLASLALRLGAWAHYRTGAIESEGAEYARIAENLRNGVGFVGLVTPGAQLNFNPLFPLLIAGASFATHDYELAARLVALMMGALLPLPVFGIAAQLFNRRVAFVAAILTMLHPLLLTLSFTAFSEGPYITLFLSAICVAIAALQRGTTGLWLLVGAAFGVAWLARAEASAGLLLVVLFAVLATPWGWTLRGKRAGLAVGMFLLCALPVIVFIYRATGELRLEVKSQIFFYTGNRIRAAEAHPGVDYESPGGHHEIPTSDWNVDSGQNWQSKWAFYGIAADGTGMGFPLRQHAKVIQDTNIRGGDMVILVLKGIRENLPVVFQRFSSDWFGAPWLPALALVGAVRRPWRGSQAKSKCFFLLAGTAPVAATFFALWSESRYYFVFVPIMAIWAANGLVEVGRWTSASMQALGREWRVAAQTLQYAVPCLIGLATVLSPVKGVRRLAVFADSSVETRVDKEVGLWLGHRQSGPVKIIDLSIPLAFHADAQFTYYPYCDASMALHYLDSAHVDYVVLRRDEKFTKYYEDWIEHGIPDGRAEPVDLPSIPGADKFRIYHWRRQKNVT